MGVAAVAGPHINGFYDVSSCMYVRTPENGRIDFASHALYVWAQHYPFFSHYRKQRLSGDNLFSYRNQWQWKQQSF